MTAFLRPPLRRRWAPLGSVFILWGALAACAGITDSSDDPGNGDGDDDGNGAVGGGPAAGGDACPGRKLSDGTAAGGAIAITCVHAPCEGHCAGPGHCNEDVVCEDDEVIYCGVHGRTFVGSSNCTQWTVQSVGECPLMNCDLRDVPCDAPPPTGYCDQAREVVDGQLGNCIPVPQCACSTDEDCPDPTNQICTPEGHCDHRVAQ